MQKQIFSPIIVLIIWFGVSTTNGQALIDFETGIVSTGYNNVGIPGDLGTRFSLKTNLMPKSEFFYRVRLNYTIKFRHTISLLYAPLRTKSVGRVTKDILFDGVVFPANTDLIGNYKFNSYRLTYRYAFVQKPKFEFGLGLTAKIRDAEIALSSAALLSKKTNVGFVPIINFKLKWNIDNKFGLLLNGDALAAPQGRAEDVLIAVTYKLVNNFSMRAGYRILEGGADNDEVYNFALFNYATVGLSYTFKKK